MITTKLFEGMYVLCGDELVQLGKICELYKDYTTTGYWILCEGTPQPIKSSLGMLRDAPITPQILKRFQFIESLNPQHQHIVTYTLKVEDFGIQYEFSGYVLSRIYFSKYGYKDIDIESAVSMNDRLIYIAQLQLLVYALTQKELVLQNF
jgi:hypothetical protein